MIFRTRDERCEFLQQFQGSQDDGGGSVAPRRFEAIKKASVGKRFETLDG